MITPTHRSPEVSVLITTYNGGKFIGASIDSILCQTFRDFELIIVDDASTDNTPNLVAAYNDPRIRYVRLDRNLGVVGARNHGIALARGTYIAALDHDDLSRPTRLAKQAAWLDENPDVVLVGTGNLIMRENGHLYLHARPFLGFPREAVPFFLHLRNGVAYSSIMFRASSVERLGTVFREDFEYVDDFDLYHRMLSLGSIDWIREPLTIWRVHAVNTSRGREKIMAARAISVLASAYFPIFGNESQRAAELIGRYFLRNMPASDRVELMEVGRLIGQIAGHFLENSPNDRGRNAISRCASQAWWQIVRYTARTGRPQLLPAYWQHPVLAGEFRPAMTEIISALVLGFFSPRDKNRC